MVSTTVIEIILQARDKASEVAKKAEDSLKKAGDGASESFKRGTTATEAMESILRKCGLTATNISKNIKNVFAAVDNAMASAKNKTNQLITQFGNLIPQFKTVAESIKHNIDTAMEHVKSKIKSILNNNAFKSFSTNAANAFNKVKNKASSVFTSIKNEIKVLSLLKPSILIKGNTEPFDKSRMHVYSALQELSRMNIKIPIGDIDSAAERIGKINAAFEKVHNAASKVGQTFSSVTNRIRSGFSSIESKISSFTNHIGQCGNAMKKLRSETGMLGQGFTILKGALSTAIGMIGYDLVSNIVEGTRATINARGNIDSFAKRLKMSENEVNSFTSQLSKLQQEFKKVDMQSVGASALELANKLNVPKNKIGDLTKTIAVMSSAFIREGRTSEDAILGVSDALDGQFKRLQEIGITQDILKKNGWNGHVEDTANLIDALNKSMEELGIEETAKQVTNLDDAWQVLNIAMSHLLTEIIIPLTPPLVRLISAFSDLANVVASWWKDMPDGAKITILSGVLAGLATVITMSVISSIQLLKIELAKLQIELLPIIVTSLEIAAIVAALVLIFYEFGKVMGWWTDGASAMQVVGYALRNMFNEIIACLQIIYNGFMEVANPVIQEFWKYLVEAIKPLKGHFKDLWDSLVKLGDAFGGASGSGSLFAWIGRILGTIFKGLIGHIKVLVAIIVPAIGFIISIVTDLINFITKIKEAFDLLMEGDIIGFLTALGDAFLSLTINVVQDLGQMFLEILKNLDLLFGGILQSLWDWIVQLVTGFSTGASDAVNGFITWISTLPSQFYLWLLDTWNKFWDWRNQLVENFNTAANNAVTGFINWISTLPGKLWTLLLNTIQKVISWASNFVDNVKRAAKEAYDKFKAKLDLKKIVQDEINHIADCLKNAVGWIGDLAANLAHSMWSRFKGEHDQHSPGRMARTIIAEVNYMYESLSDGASTLSSKASDTAKSIIQGFNSNDFSSLTVSPNIDIDSSSYTVPEVSASASISMNPSLVTNDNEMISDSMVQMQQQVSTQLSQLEASITELGITSNTNMNQLINENTLIANSYNNLRNNIHQSLQDIRNNNTAQWNYIKTTTEQDLKKILNSTNDVTKQMIQAWNTMKNSIVKAADNIKSESANRFNTLWSTIKTFYHNIQHPGGAGTPATSSRGGSRGFSSVGSAIRTGLSSIARPTKKKLSSIDLNGIIPNNSIEYMIPNGSRQMVASSDVLRFLKGYDHKGAGWDGIASSNNKYIKDKSNLWNVAGPVILGKYSTGLDIFKVKDFENGTPTISFETFRKMAEAVLSQCHYEYYFDSDKYGTWQNAARGGGMNCSDSSDFLIALARACGLPAEKVHGHWNNIGHFWANIAGHKMDTTGWMIHRNWTPSQSHAGPSPEPTPFNSNGTLEHKGTVKLEIKHIIEGNLPEGITKEELGSLLSEKITDREVIKALTSSMDFQELDKRFKEKILGARSRYS